MALQDQSPSEHNVILGTKKIPHPLSTNFELEDSGLPPSKRVRRFDRGLRAGISAGDASIAGRTEIQDSEDGEEDEEGARVPPAGSQTDLETALPPVKSDQEAIAEYEAYKAGEAGEKGVRDRLDDGSWNGGRSSIYVDAFNLALDTVLEHESHLFDAAEKTVFAHWHGLNYESQYLYVRLFLRKSHAWHRIKKLGYHSDIADLETAVGDLQRKREVPIPPQETEVESVGLETPRVTLIADGFCFAESSEDHISTLDEASSLLLLDELKTIAKDARVQGKNKKELLTALRTSSGKQSGLDFRGLRRSDSEDSVPLADTGSPAELGEGAETSSRRMNRDALYTGRILEHTGKCIRLSTGPLHLFERVHLVFYRSTEWTEKSLTTTILAKISRRNFPEYVVSRSANIFPTRSLLLEFEASLRLQYKVDSILEFNGTPSRADLEEVKAIMEEVYPRWRTLLVEEQGKEDRVYESGEGHYLRRFSPAWVYTRIVHKGLHPLARFKEHRREHEILTELLQQRLFHAARRGAWYQRKALLEEHYLHALTPTDGRSEEAQRKHWRGVALRTCEHGLEDRECHLIYHHDLQKRIKKLEKGLKLPLRERHDFGPVGLVKPIERTVEGVRIEREMSPSANNSARRRSNTPTRKSGGGGGGTKTIWVDEHEFDGECSVEAMCLSHYRHQGQPEPADGTGKMAEGKEKAANGRQQQQQQQRQASQGSWKGHHDEGGLLRTLFGLVFYDILFTYVPNVFQTEYQICPLDLFTDAFYPTRLSEINTRLATISNGGAEAILVRVWNQHVHRRTCVVGVDWDSYPLQELVEVVRCFGGDRLATVCRLMAQEYQQRGGGGGVPDLFLWRLDRCSCCCHPHDRAADDEEKEQNEDEDEDKDRCRASTCTCTSTGTSTGTRPGGEIMFSEVKSQNDRLSDTQRLWIHVLTLAGIPVELCRAVAREVRTTRIGD